MRKHVVLKILSFVVIAAAIGISSEALAQVGPFVVDTLSDGAGADIDGSRTFRWAVNQANSNGEGLDRIEFHTDLIALDIDDDEVLQIILTSLPLVIQSELEIVGPVSIGTGPMGVDEDIFIDIVTDPSLNTFFQTTKNLTLENVDLRSLATLFNGGTTGGGNDLDLVYDIRGFKHDVTWGLFESVEGLPKDGDGRLVKLGTGELALLPSDSNYTGGTLLVDGVLRTDADGLTGDVQICADGDEGFTSDSCEDALLIFQMPGIRIDEDLFTEPRDTNGTYAGNITGETVGGEDGRVVKIGPGRLTLTGNSDYDGGTYILEGEVVGDLDAIQGDVHICPGVASIIDPNSTMDFDCDVEQQSTLTFDVDDDGTFSDDLFGQGIVAKDGSGQLTFDTDQAAFKGDVEVRRGELVLENQIGTFGGSMLDEVDVTVEDDATLSGSGTIGGGVTVERGGTVRGTLDIEGELTLGGTLDLTNEVMTTGTASLNSGGGIMIDPFIAGGPGQLTASGAVTAAGGSVFYVFDPDAADAFDTDYYTLVESSVAVTGTLPEVEQVGGGAIELALFDLTVSFNDTTNCTGTGNICLLKGFSPVLADDASNRNHRQLARALDAAYACAQDPGSPECGISQSTADDFNDVHPSFDVLSSQIPGFLNEVAGEEYAAFAEVRSAGATRFNRSISRRFDLARSPEPTPGANGSTTSATSSPRSPFAAFAAPATQWMTLGAGALNMQANPDFRDYRNRRFPWRQKKQEEPASPERQAGKGGWTGWMDLHGVSGEVGGGKNTDDVDYRIYGPLFGLDYGLTDIITLGVTAGFTRNELETPGKATKGTGTTYQVGAYAAAVIGDLYVTGAGRYARSNVSTRRDIEFGDVDKSAKGDFDASDASAFIEAAYAFSLPYNTMIQPVVSLAYNRLHQSSFEERRADSLALDVGSQNVDALMTHIGVRLGLFGTQDNGGYLLPQLRLGYEREWLDDDRDISQNLGSAGENGEFEVTGLSMPRDRAVVGVSSEVGVSSSTNLFVDYDLRASEDFLEHSLSFGVRAIW